MYAINANHLLRLDWYTIDDPQNFSDELFSHRIMQGYKIDEKTTLHSQERFSGRFRRVVSLPDDIDPNGVSAAYRDGVLRVSVKRREAAQPRRITVQ